MAFLQGKPTHAHDPLFASVGKLIQEGGEDSETVGWHVFNSRRLRAGRQLSARVTVLKV
jgi:hypothetical protein